MLNKNAINKLAKEIKKINEDVKSYNSSELKKATIKDLEKLIICTGLNDYTMMKNTKLYNNLSSGYCIAQEIICNFNLIEDGSIYEFEGKYYYRESPEDILEGTNLKKYYVNKAYSYIFEVVEVDEEIKKHIFNLVKNMETVLYKKESNLYWNNIIKNIKDELKVDGNIFIEKVEKMNGKKINKKQINKILSNIQYNL